MAWTKDRERHILAVVAVPGAAYLGYQMSLPEPDWQLTSFQPNIAVAVIAGLFLSIGAALFLIAIRKVFPAARIELRSHEMEKGVALAVAAIMMILVAAFAVTTILSDWGRNGLMSIMTWLHNHNARFPSGDHIGNFAARQSFLFAGIIVMTITVMMWHHKPWKGRLLKSMHAPHISMPKRKQRGKKEAKSSKRSAPPMTSMPSTSSHGSPSVLESAILSTIGPGADVEGAMAQLHRDYPGVSDEALAAGLQAQPAQA